jgi:vacuolar-type H+-ATPase subunit H
MDDTLKRLLEAEEKADALVKKSLEERDRLVEQALVDVKTADARFRARLPELRESFQRKAEERAEQAVAEITRRHEERTAHLEAETAKRRSLAAELGLEVLMKPSRD